MNCKAKSTQEITLYVSYAIYTVTPRVFCQYGQQFYHGLCCWAPAAKKSFEVLTRGWRTQSQLELGTF